MYDLTYYQVTCDRARKYICDLVYIGLHARVSTYRCLNLYIEAYLLLHSLLTHLCKCTLIGLPIRQLKIHACEDAHISVPTTELKDTCMCEPS